MKYNTKYMCTVKFYSMGEITLQGHVLGPATMCFAHIHALTHFVKLYPFPFSDYIHILLTFKPILEMHYNHPSDLIPEKNREK